HAGDRALFTDEVTLDPFGQEEQRRTVTIPADVPTGIYRIGLIVDPDGLVDELDERDKIHRSEPFPLTSSVLRIETEALPTASLGAPYSVRLDASGGDGTSAWSVDAGSELPAGLELEAEGGT